MLDTVAWWLTLQVMGLAALPVTVELFRPLADRGYALSKALGVLLAGWVAFSLASAGVSFGPTLAWISLVAVLLLSVWRVLRRRGALLREILLLGRSPGARSYVLFTEALFAGALAIWAWVRGTSPDIWGTEKFMDFAMLNSIMRGGPFPPPDVWLAGHPVNYYYVGHVLVAEVADLAGTSPPTAFNLANVAWFALTCTGAFSVTFNLMARRPAGNQQRRVLSPYPFALLAALMVVAMGNLTTLFAVKSPDYAVGANGWTFCLLCQDPGSYNWWNPSRVIRDYTSISSTAGVTTRVPARDETINEFPAFSFFLGDLHPHVMALPFVLLALAAAQALFAGRAPPSRILISGLIVGSLYPVNSWDYPTYLVIALAAHGMSHLWPFRRASRPERSGQALLRWLGEAGVLVGAGLLAWLPFWSSFTPPTEASSGFVRAPEGLRGTTGGIMVETLGNALLPNTADKTAGGFLVIFGIFLVPIVAWLASLLWTKLASLPVRREMSRALRGPALVVGLCLAGAVLLRMPLLALLGPVSAASLALVSTERADRQRSFALMLIGLGAALAVVTEAVFLRDAFVTRMNTLFKAYFQLWVLWSIAAAYAGYSLAGTLLSPVGRGAPAVPPPGAFTSTRSPRLLPGVALGLFALLSLSGLAYPFLAQASALAQAAPEPGAAFSLDGSRYLSARSPGDLQAIHWLTSNTARTDIVLECCSDEYNTTSGRISVFTGNPTLVAWDGHERQWRAGQPAILAQIAERRKIVNAIYRGDDPASPSGAPLDTGGLLRLLRDNQVGYVVVGDTERGSGAAKGGKPGEHITARADALFRQSLSQVFTSSDGRTLIYKVPVLPER